jgi:hypothetical protein
MHSVEVGEISAAEVFINTPGKVNHATDALFDVIAVWVQQIQHSL